MPYPLITGATGSDAAISAYAPHAEGGTRSSGGRRTTGEVKEAQAGASREGEGIDHELGDRPLMDGARFVVEDVDTAVADLQDDLTPKIRTLGRWYNCQN